MNRIWTIISPFLLTVLFSSMGEAKERVIIIYNSDPSKWVTMEDGLADSRNIDWIQEHIARENQNLSVEKFAVDSIEGIKNAVTSSSDPIRSIVFLGHGNQDAYALNAKTIFSGDNLLPETLAELFNHAVLSDKLVLYFAGCSMGAPKKGGRNFQETLYYSLSEKLKPELRERVEIIAHSATVDMKAISLSRPSTIDRFFYKSKIGAMFQRFDMVFSRFVGAYGPTISNISIVFGAAAVGILGFPELKQEIIGIAFGTIILKNVASTAIGRFGQSISARGKVLDSVYELFGRSVVAVRCESVLVAQ